jgi:hypothetical protein
MHAYDHHPSASPSGSAIDHLSPDSVGYRPIEKWFGLEREKEKAQVPESKSHKLLRTGEPPRSNVIRNAPAPL